MLADIAEVSENSSLHIEEYLEEVDPVAKMLAERTDKLLEKKRRKRHKAKLELEDDIKLEARSARGGRQTAVPERAKYCSESELRENTESVLMSKFAWVLEEKKLTDDQSALNIPTEEIGNTSEDIDIIQSDAKLMKPAETTSCRDQLKKIYLGGSGSQMVDTNDQIESEPDNSQTTETNGEEKEKTLTQSSDDRKIIDDVASDKGRKIELSFLIYPGILATKTSQATN